MNADILERRARRNARAKLSWYTHAAVYLAVNLGLMLLSLSSGRYWAVYPALGWGLGLLLHGVSVWFLSPGNALLERMVAQERARLAAAAPRNDQW